LGQSKFITDQEMGISCRGRIHSAIAPFHSEMALPVGRLTNVPRSALRLPVLLSEPLRGLLDENIENRHISSQLACCRFDVCGLIASQREAVIQWALP
jgi:hypothetical protein